MGAFICFIVVALTTGLMGCCDQPSSSSSKVVRSPAEAKNYTVYYTNGWRGYSTRPLHLDRMNRIKVANHSQLTRQIQPKPLLDLPHPGQWTAAMSGGLVLHMLIRSRHVMNKQ